MLTRFLLSQLQQTVVRQPPLLKHSPSSRRTDTSILGCCNKQVCARGDASKYHCCYLCCNFVPGILVAEPQGTDEPASAAVLASDNPSAEAHQATQQHSSQQGSRQAPEQHKAAEIDDKAMLFKLYDLLRNTDLKVCATSTNTLWMWCSCLQRPAVFWLMQWQHALFSDLYKKVYAQALLLSSAT